MSKTLRTSILSRRFRQFSLRTLLLVMTVASIWLGYEVRQAGRQSSAVKALTALGHEVTYDFHGNGLDDYEATIQATSATTFTFIHGSDLSAVSPPQLASYVGTDFTSRATTLKFNGDIAEARKSIDQIRQLPYLRKIYLWGGGGCIDRKADAERKALAEYFESELPNVEIGYRTLTIIG
jgi:hypothetical protein